jgi:hypothetical protein
MREKAHRMIRLELRRILNSKDDYNPVSLALLMLSKAWVQGSGIRD